MILAVSNVGDMHLSIFLFVIIFFMPAAFADNRPKLILAGNISVPYVMKEGRKYVGADIELMRELARRVGLELVVKGCPLARCFKLLEQGDVDIITGLMYTKERSEFLNYLEPHYYTSQVPLVFYFHRDRKFTLRNYDDLRSLSIGVERGVRYFEPFDSDTQLKKVVLTEQSQMVQMLLKQRIDTFIEREESVIPLVDQTVYYRDLVKADYKVTKDTKGYIALSKRSDYAKYTDKFSKALSDMKEEGVIKRIFRQYGLYHD